MAVQVLGHDDKGQLCIRKGAFKNLEEQRDLAECEVVVIAVVGAYRRGKSFLLNQISRYLTQQDDSCGDFEFKGGIDRNTDGILMSRAYPFGSKRAVILLDSEGFHDEQSTQTSMSHVFAVSALVSSLLVFNVHERITKQVMDEIQFLSEVGAAQGGNSAAFQRLMFLVRDWKFSNELEFGIEGGRRHLENWQQADRDGVVATLHKCFSAVDCFLMPHPGEKIASGNTTGAKSDMDREFSSQLVVLLKLIFDLRMSTPKMLNGKSLKVKDFPRVFEMFFKALNTSGHDIKSAFQGQAEQSNREARERAVEEYRSRMDQELTGNQQALSEELLKDFHKVHTKRAKEQFLSAPKLGGEVFSGPALTQLEKDLLSAFRRFCRQEEMKREYAAKMSRYENEAADLNASIAQFASSSAAQQQQMREEIEKFQRRMPGVHVSGTSSKSINNFESELQCINYYEFRIQAIKMKCEDNIQDVMENEALGERERNLKIRNLNVDCEIEVLEVNKERDATLRALSQQKKKKNKPRALDRTISPHQVSGPSGQQRNSRRANNEISCCDIL